MVNTGSALGAEDEVGAKDQKCTLERVTAAECNGATWSAAVGPQDKVTRKKGFKGEVRCVRAGDEGEAKCSWRSIFFFSTLKFHVSSD